MPRPNTSATRVDDGDDGVSGPPSRLMNVAAAQKELVATKRKNLAAKSTSSKERSINSNNNNSVLNNVNADQDLIHLEKRLNEEVDEEFFEEPRRFNTLPRVIDVLGVQMIDDATVHPGGTGSGGGLLAQNPAYQQLKAQQAVVESAIEHMAVIHCSNLNASVISVGRVARQFNDAVERVRNLRKQVRDIQDSLGPSSSSNPNEAPPNAKDSAAVTPRPPPRGGVGGGQNAAAMSLRELWLKKLECEATLALLDKLDIIRAAPARFDDYMKKSRIGAAVLCVSLALDTMFRDDVAQVQALHKIMEQLMIRKQTAEEIVWDTLRDVVFLRTGNGLKSRRRSTNTNNPLLTRKGSLTGRSVSGPGDFVVLTGGSVGGVGGASTTHSVSSESRRSGGGGGTTTSGSASHHSAGGATSASTAAKGSANKVVITNGILNPFLTRTFRFATVDDEEDEFASYWMNISGGGNDRPINDGDTVASDDSHASLFSIEGEVDATPTNGGTSGGNSKEGVGKKRRLLIPIPMIEAELDLESDERRIQEEIALSGMATQSSLNKKSMGGGSGGGGDGPVSGTLMHSHHHRWALPRYADHVWGLRILVECVAYLKRLDDVERQVAESIQAEIRFLVQQEQARTFARMERRQQLMSQSVVRAGTSGSGGHAKGGGAGLLGGGGASHDPLQASMREFRRHLTGLLSAFGSVLMRLSHLAQILRFRISSDRELLQKMESPTSVMRPLISSAMVLMQREIKEFLQACIKEPEQGTGTTIESSVRQSAEVGGFFSLGVIEDPKGESEAAKLATATRSNVMEMPTSRFVPTVLFSKTKSTPHTRNALAFRRMIARWTSETDSLKHELAFWTGEDKSSHDFNTPGKSDGPLAFLDMVIQKELLPTMQEEAVNGTVLGLERRDAFDPVMDRAVFNRPNSNEPQDVDMCIACQSVYASTGPLFLALHRLPRGGGEMYLPVVAVLEHVMLTFISRIKHQMSKLCEQKTAKILLEKGGKPSTLALVMTKRQPFVKLIQAYAEGDMLEAVLSTVAPSSGGSSSASKLAPPTGDTPRLVGEDADAEAFLNEEVPDGVEGEEALMQMELTVLQPYFDFVDEKVAAEIKVCTDEELMKAEALAHSLLKVASLLESRLKVRNNSSSFHKALTSTRTLREAIKSVLQSGLHMAKFCRLDMLLQTVTRLSKVCKSSTLVARDAVRIPSSVNDLGEYLTGASDNLREAAGNAVTAYTFSSLEQYIPYCLMQTVRVVAAGNGILQKAPLTMNGIEALDRSGSVLYRDLKGATAFDNSYWDVDLAAFSFERSASFMALMELEMEELVAYYNANPTDFDKADFELMFSMTGPRRQGDVGRFHMMNRQSSSRAAATSSERAPSSSSSSRRSAKKDKR